MSDTWTIAAALLILAFHGEPDIHTLVIEWLSAQARP
jgi:hypothetical protein